VFGACFDAETSRSPVMGRTSQTDPKAIFPWGQGATEEGGDRSFSIVALASAASWHFSPHRQRAVLQFANQERRRLTDRACGPTGLRSRYHRLSTRHGHAQGEMRRVIMPVGTDTIDLPLSTIHSTSFRYDRRGQAGSLPTQRLARHSSKSWGGSSAITLKSSMS
jgi:hypothetical protein